MLLITATFGFADKAISLLNVTTQEKQLILEEIDGARMTVPPGPEMSGFLTSFTIDGCNLNKIVHLLWTKYRIQIAATHAGDQSVFRISTHFYDCYEDIDRFIDALKAVLVNQRDEVFEN